MPLSKESGASEWIHHFVHSDNPRFKGKSKEERIQMALGAYYSQGDAALDRDVSQEERKSLAKKGKALPGGGFPIKNKGDLENAIRAFGRAKNKPAAKALIKKRARELGATEMLPESWDAAAFPDWIVYTVQDDSPKAIFDAWNATSLEDRRGRNGDDEDDDNGDDEDDDDFADAKTVQLTDQFLIDGIRKTKDGYLVCDARISRTGVQLYQGVEVGKPDAGIVRVYRSPEEVFSRDALHSLAHRPITLNHPPVMVDASNWKQYAVGQTGDEVVRDGDHVRVPMVIMDAQAIEAYEKHGVKELSVGYSTELKWGRGTTADGEPYDAKQTAIRGNHLAVVPAARGGSLLRIGDDQAQAKESHMAKILVGDRLVEFGDETEAKHVQAYIAQLQKDAKKNDDDDDADDIEEERKKVTAEKDALNGEIIALKKQLEDAKSQLTDEANYNRAKALTDLILKADAALEGKVNLDGKSPAEIRRIVVSAKLGDAAKDLKDDEVVGAFKALTAGVKPRTGTDRLADSLSLLAHGGGSNQNDPKAIKDAAYAEHLKDLNNAWRGRTAQ